MMSKKTPATAKEAFRLNVYAQGAEWSYVGDGNSRFLVRNEALDEEIELPDSEDEQVHAYDRWSVDSKVREENDFRLIDSASRETVSREALGIDYSEWCSAVVESLTASQIEGHIRVAGRRVFAA